MAGCDKRSHDRLEVFRMLVLAMDQSDESLGRLATFSESLPHLFATRQLPAEIVIPGFSRRAAQDEVR